MKIKMKEFTQLDQLVLNQAQIRFCVAWTDETETDLSCELEIEEFDFNQIETYAVHDPNDFEIQGFIGYYEASNFVRRNWKLVHGYLEEEIRNGFWASVSEFLIHLNRIFSMDATTDELFESYYNIETERENQNGEFMRDRILQAVAIYLGQSVFSKITESAENED